MPSFYREVSLDANGKGSVSIDVKYPLLMGEGIAWVDFSKNEIFHLLIYARDKVTEQAEGVSVGGGGGTGTGAGGLTLVTSAKGMYVEGGKEIVVEVDGGRNFANQVVKVVIPYEVYK